MCGLHIYYNIIMLSIHTVHHHRHHPIFTCIGERTKKKAKTRSSIYIIIIIIIIILS
jgi:hypothetical protein